MGRAEAVSLDGDRLASILHHGLADRTAALRDRGIVPTLATVLVGSDPSSTAYIGRKHGDCRALCIEVQDIRLPREIPQAALSEEIRRLNRDRAVHGFMVQLPLPSGLDERRALEEVDPGKDIDGLHPVNLGRLLGGYPGLLPCTPAGVLALLNHYEVPLSGRHVVVVGRGALVGRPLAMLLTMRGVDAAVTLVHSQTPDIARLTRQADILVAAVGIPRFVTPDMVRQGAAVVGVGISYDRDGAMISDVADEVVEVAGWVTPPHGSVGPLTRAMLLSNLLSIASGSG